MVSINSNWRNRPTYIDYIPKDVDYVINIDENGTGNLKKLLKERAAGNPIPEGELHFAITACVIRSCDFSAAKEMVMGLKQKYWENALFSYDGKQKRVCFHSKDIRERKGAFHPDVIDYCGFVKDLTQMIEELPIVLYSAYIDKLRHVEKYTYPDPPYDLCINFVLERIMRDMGENEKCIVVLESRGKKEDLNLLNQIKVLLDHGNQYNSASQFDKICGVYFNPKWCMADDEQKSYWALEIADVCSYPIYKYFAYGNKDKAFDVVETKLKYFPYYRGRGVKIFP